MCLGSTKGIGHRLEGMKSPKAKVSMKKLKVHRHHDGAKCDTTEKSLQGQLQKL